MVEKQPVIIVVSLFQGIYLLLALDLLLRLGPVDPFRIGLGRKYFACFRIDAFAGERYDVGDSRERVSRESRRIVRTGLPSRITFILLFRYRNRFVVVEFDAAVSDYGVTYQFSRFDPSSYVGTLLFVLLRCAAESIHAFRIIRLVGEILPARFLRFFGMRLVVAGIAQRTDRAGFVPEGLQDFSLRTILEIADPYAGTFLKQSLRFGDQVLRILAFHARPVLTDVAVTAIRKKHLIGLVTRTGCTFGLIETVRV